MPILFRDVEGYIASKKRALKDALVILDNIIREAKEERPKEVPIYLTSFRIKTPESTFLKTKRKKLTSYEQLNTITDLAGYRILSLFEQDILKIHDFLVDSLFNGDYKLEEFNVYNWKSLKSIDYFNAKIDVSLRAIPEARPSGYKSLHYLVKYQLGTAFHYIEIQLRTLFQDIWAQLEHALSYKKGNIHQHIRKSFLLLANELENKDILIDHLKDIRFKETATEKLSSAQAGPKVFFDYADESIPVIFKNGEPKAKFEAYMNYMKNVELMKKREEDIRKAKALLEAVSRTYTANDMNIDTNLVCFEVMEQGFMAFWTGNYDEALKIYNRSIEKMVDHYILMFRIGEIHAIKGNTVKALASFDDCENALAKTTPSDHMNQYTLKTKLSYMYWLLGHEYIDFSIRKIEEAESIATRRPRLLTEERDKIALHNNMAAYYLEKFIVIREKLYSNIKFNEQLSNENQITLKGLYQKTFEQIKIIETALANDYANANMFDTVAWFYFQSFLEYGNRSHLEKAKELCNGIMRAQCHQLYKMMASNIHKNHIGEIMKRR